MLRLFFYFCYILPVSFICLFFLGSSLCMHGIEGCGVGPQRNRFPQGTNRDIIIIKWDDMCNDRLQFFSFSFLLDHFQLMVAITLSLSASKQAVCINRHCDPGYGDVFLLSFSFFVAFIWISWHSFLCSAFPVVFSF